MPEEPGRRQGDRGRSRREDLGESASNESYYSLERDNMLRVDRRSAQRTQSHWVVGDNLEPRFADHVQLTKVDQHYHLTFGQSRVPIVREENEPTPVTEIQPIVRLVLPEGVLQRFEATLRRRLSGAG
ncbi:MAG: hypothetical protein JSW71_10775 [Gemmatimonadota bacterium]|nr:MAG: hypothetical protein JSW71_10775 [Gemmatimonadota bacterium]